VIKSAAAGTADVEGDHFGFVAEEIRAFRAGGVKFNLAPGPRNDLAGLTVGSSGDLRVREIL
jgi:hypothetical protein